MKNYWLALAEEHNKTHYTYREAWLDGSIWEREIEVTPGRIVIRYIKIDHSEEEA